MDATATGRSFLQPDRTADGRARRRFRRDHASRHGLWDCHRSAGFSVVGYDREESLISRLDRQDLPILEPDLDRFLAANRNRSRFSSVPSDVSRCDVVYIAADVPTDDAAISFRSLLWSTASPVICAATRFSSSFTKCRPALHVPFPQCRTVGCPIKSKPRSVGARSSGPLNALSWAARTRESRRRPDIRKSSKRSDVQPRRCDTRAPSWQRSASISVSLHPLPSPMSLPSFPIDRCGLGRSCPGPAPRSAHRSIKLSQPRARHCRRQIERDLRTVLNLVGERGTDTGMVNAWIATRVAGAIGAGACYKIGW